MSAIQLTAAQRRQMKKLAPCIDDVTAGDRIFFEQNPQRRHRIRFCHPCEIATNEIIDGEPWTPPAGWAWFTVVKNIVPGVRTRLYTSFYADAPTDVDEDTARDIYRQLETPASREFEQAIHTAKSKGGSQ